MSEIEILSNMASERLVEDRVTLAGWKQDVKEMVRETKREKVLKVFPEPGSERTIGDNAKMIFKSNIFRGPVCLGFNKTEGKIFPAEAVYAKFDTRADLDIMVSQLRHPIYCIFSQVYKSVDKRTFKPTGEPDYTKYCVRYFPAITLSWFQSKAQIILSRLSLPLWARGWAYRWFCTTIA